MKRDGRLHIRLPENLKKEVQLYAERHHTDITTLVTRFFVQLLEHERRQKAPVDAEQV